MKHGLILVHKPEGITSHDCVSLARKKLNTKKIGHCGTLDPFASGVLVLLIGEAARLQRFFLHKHKGYKAKVTFGYATDTDDRTGKTIDKHPHAFNLNESKITQILSEKFKGEIEQRPPYFSAIHVDGVRAYTLAQKGEQPVLKTRMVEIIKNEILSIDQTSLTLNLIVSAGTYIRSIARDLGILYGVPAHLSELKRTSSGDFSLEQCISIEEIHEDKIIDFSSYLSFTGGIIHPEETSIHKLHQGLYTVLGKLENGLTAIKINQQIRLILETKENKSKACFNTLKEVTPP